MLNVAGVYQANATRIWKLCKIGIRGSSNDEQTHHRLLRRGRRIKRLKNHVEQQNAFNKTCIFRGLETQRKVPVSQHIYDLHAQPYVISKIESARKSAQLQSTTSES